MNPPHTSYDTPITAHSNSTELTEIDFIHEPTLSNEGEVQSIPEFDHKEEELQQDSGSKQDDTAPLVEKNFYKAPRDLCGVWTFFYWIQWIVILLFSIGYCIVILVILPSLKIQKFPYKTLTSRVGFGIHVLPGIIYFITCALQFFSTLRQRFPLAHRVIGYISYICQILSSIGLIVICVGGPVTAHYSTYVIVSTFVPLWLFWSFAALYYIRRGDVLKHNIYQIRAFGLSLSITAMRPCVLILQAITTHLSESDRTPGAQLRIVLWWNWVWGIVITELYIYFRYRRSAVIAPIISPNGIDTTPLNSYTEVELVQSEVLNERTKLLRFAMPRKNMHLNYTPTQYVMTSVKVPGKMGSYQRAYTIMTDPSKIGHVDLIVRQMKKGTVSTRLHSMQVGDKISIMGPIGKFDYFPNQYKSIGMIAGGSGLNPLFTIARSILSDPNDHTKITMMIFNSCNEEVYLESELKEMEGKFGSTRFTVHFFSGVRMSKDLASSHLPAASRDVKVLVCGSISFNTSITWMLTTKGYFNVYGIGTSDR